MSILEMALIVGGLIVFEIISSVDNAIINAEVLSTMREKSRRWFLFWGIIIGVFMVRGLLPWVIVWVAMPDLGFVGSLTATFSSDPEVHEAIEQSTPILLLGGGVFLVLLFLHWLFVEEKHYGLPTEAFFHKHGVWFFAIASLMLAITVWYALKLGPLNAFAAVVGSTAFFITHGFKENAEHAEQGLKNSNMSDISKILYLEVIDMTFSVDGVLGAFAFTLSVPLILIGNGIGAIVVRQITVSNVDKIKEYRYLKNGAMYSIMVLGAIMMAEGFHIEIPTFVTPVCTFVIVGAFFIMSVVDRRKRIKSGELKA